MNRIHVNKDYRDDFKERYRQHRRLVDQSRDLPETFDVASNSDA